LRGLWRQPKRPAGCSVDPGAAPTAVLSAAGTPLVIVSRVIAIEVPAIEAWRASEGSA